MPELRVVPNTQWVGVRGFHPGALVEVRRVTPTAVYFRIIREGAAAGPRHRRGGPKNRLGHAEFLLNYRPNTKRDWQMATVEALEEHTVTEPEAVPNGRLHADEEAIAQAIRDGAKFHDVQRDYHVQGLVLSKIIDKYHVPYESTRIQRARQKAEQDASDLAHTLADVPVVEAPVDAEALEEERLRDSLYAERDAEGEAEEQAIQALEPLHPQEAEIAEVLRTRTATYREVLATYHVSPTLVSRIRAKHNIPGQTAEEKREIHRRHYERKRQEALEEQAEAELATEAVQEAAEQAVTPVEASAPIVAAPGLHRWQVTVRTTLLQTYVAADYLSAAQAALAANPSGTEIIGLARVEGSAA